MSRLPRHSLSHGLFLSLDIYEIVRLRLEGHSILHYFIFPSVATQTEAMRLSILLPTLACLILIVAYRVRGFSSGAPEESCDSLTVMHTHVGSPSPGAECGPPCPTTSLCVETCRQFRQLRLIGSSADSFIYNCNETYQCEFYISAAEVNSTLVGLRPAIAVQDNLRAASVLLKSRRFTHNYIAYK